MPSPFVANQIRQSANMTLGKTISREEEKRAKLQLRGCSASIRKTHAISMQWRIEQSFEEIK